MDKGGRTILIILVVLIVLAFIAYALGLFNVDSSGEVEMPEVDVSAEGGEVPDVQVETGDIDVGSEEVEMEVPTLDVDPVDDDGSAQQ